MHIVAAAGAHFISDTWIPLLDRPGHPLSLTPEMAGLMSAHRVSSLDGCREGGILLLHDVMVDVAAEEVRAALAEGRSVAHLLPVPVAHYIRQHGLYRDPN